VVLLVDNHAVADVALANITFAIASDQKRSLLNLSISIWLVRILIIWSRQKLRDRVVRYKFFVAGRVKSTVMINCPLLVINFVFIHVRWQDPRDTLMISSSLSFLLYQFWIENIITIFLWSMQVYSGFWWFKIHVFKLTLYTFARYLARTPNNLHIHYLIVFLQRRIPWLWLQKVNVLL
jgi:hypothetical protein